MSNSRLEWRGTVSRSSLDEPDIRETLYQEIGGVYLLADESQSGLRQFNNLDEKAWDVGANWSTTFAGISNLPAMIKFGIQATNRERDFASRRFRFVPIDVVRFDLSPAPEQLFTPANIGPRFELREETRNTDFYDAAQRTTSGFGMIDASLSARTRLIAGARVERFRQQVDTFDLFDTDADDEIEVIRGEIVETDLFPSVGFVYALRADQNLRLGFSQTVNRPEFREVAPFEFTDIVGGRAVVGNPDLQRSLIRNYDVRWEWFPRALEVISVSGFFKQFDQPIERVVEATAQLRTSFANAKSARNFGFEFEARKDLTGTLTLGGNYSFVDSSIELESAQTVVLTSLERPLAGTSRHVFNGLLELRTPLVTGRLLVNAFGDRISDVGSLGLPDIIEDGRATVDLVLMRRIGHLDFRFAAENLGNAEVRYSQGPETHRLFTVGRVFAFRVGVAGF
jgi:outer membrane receptor protein involved in Fe transport